jgi:hypothetical protein
MVRRTGDFPCNLVTICNYTSNYICIYYICICNYVFFLFLTVPADVVS